MTIATESESATDDRSLDQIAEDIAHYIIKDGVRVPTLKTLLIEFAEEIKRQSIEP